MYNMVVNYTPGRVIKIPHYDYKCERCGTIRTVQHGMNERPEVLCDCHETEVAQPMKKLISKSTIVTYKGEGWTRKEAANEAAGIPAGVAKTAEELGRL